MKKCHLSKADIILEIATDKFFIEADVLYNLRYS